MSALDTLALTATTLLPFALLHARALADALISGIDLLFLARCAFRRDWAWTRHPWVAVAVALWGWLVISTLAEGSPQADGQAVVVLRLLLFVAACEAWTLRDARARRYLALSMGLAAAWIAVECWQQFLTGRNIFGDPRWGDGALTGPFFKPHAGASYLGVFFPAVLPPALALLRRGRPLASLLLLAAASATMVLIGQRMPTLLMALGLALAALLVRRLRAPALVALALALVVIAATPVIAPPTYHKLVLHFIEQMQHFWTSNYGQLYLRATAMLETSPLFGLGVAGFRAHCLDAAYIHGSALLGVPDSAVDAVRGCNIHPHNYWMQMATSGGWPAVVLFTLLVAIWLTRLLRGLDTDARPIRAALLVMFVVQFWPFASTSSLFVVDAGGFAFLAAAWGLAEAASDRQADART